MAFKVRRQSRKMKYMHVYGLLPFEAHMLSQIPEKIPYMKRLLNDRRNLLRRAITEGWTQKEYEAEIQKQYEDNNWKVTAGAITRTKSVGVHDPWAMLRDKRDEFIRDFPDEYQPPPEKKGRGKMRELDEEKLEKGKRRAKGDVAAQRKRASERAKERRAFEKELADIPGIPIYGTSGEYLGKTVEYRGRVFTVRKDGTIM